MTTRTERFFTWVWRINALILFGIGLVSIVVLAILFVDAQSSRYEPPEAAVEEVAGTDLVAGELELRSFMPLAGTPFLTSNLVNPSSGRGSSAYDEYVRNILFLDVRSKQSRWLFTSNDQYIEWNARIMNEPGGQYGQRVTVDQQAIALLLSIADAPPNAPVSRQMVAVSIDGSRVVELSDPIDEMLSYYHVDPESYLVVYVRNGKMHVLDFDPTTFDVRSDSPLVATP